MGHTYLQKVHPILKNKECGETDAKDLSGESEGQESYLVREFVDKSIYQYNQCTCPSQRKRQSSSTLSPEYATEVRDLILRMPVTQPYDTIRDQLESEQRHPTNVNYSIFYTPKSSGIENPQNSRMQQLLGDMRYPTYAWSSLLPRTLRA